jgi:3-dehydroquinate dehydratase-1
MMSRATTAFRAGRRKLAVGAAPLVVGTISSLDRKFPPGRSVPACDLVEVRLDLAGRPPGWLDRCKAIQAAGWPVLLTIRLAAEGGGWDADDEERLSLFDKGLRSLAGADVEWRGKIARRVARLAKSRRKVCVISYHDFERTPPRKELEGVVAEAQEWASIVKISTRLNSGGDEEVLRSLLAGKWKKPLCVIGMGAAWARTRVSFPRLGSCLAYGWLDKPTAPGQLSAAQLTRKLSPSQA